MKFGERMDVPKPIEKLPEQERVKRLHHQLGVIYDRVYLTGDWEGQMTETVEPDAPIRENIFENKSVQDIDILVENIADFLKSVPKTLPAFISPKDMETLKGIHDYNRRLFKEVVQNVHDILKQSKKDIGFTSDIELMKCIDQHIHYFRDLPANLPRGENTDRSPVEDERKAAEGLQKILEGLSAIIENSKPHE